MLPGVLAEAGELSDGHICHLSEHCLPALKHAFVEKLSVEQEALESCTVPQPLLAFRNCRGPAERSLCLHCWEREGADERKSLLSKASFQPPLLLLTTSWPFCMFSLGGVLRASIYKIQGPSVLPIPISHKCPGDSGIWR